MFQNVLSPTKANDHITITDEQRSALTYLQRQKNDSSVFTCDIEEIQQIEREKAIIISQSHMDKLKNFRQEYLEKKKRRTATTMEKICPMISIKRIENESLNGL